MDRTHHTVTVVGAGIAGLTAAIHAARDGATVRLLDAHPIGGRARSSEMAGCRFNLGPHALYRGGAGMAVLSELGIDPTGDVPQDPQFAHHDGELHRLPTTPGSLLRTTLLGAAEKATIAKLLAGLARLDATELDDRTVDDWIEDTTSRPAAVALLRGLVRIATYGADHDLAAAGPAVRQLQLAVADNVLYLDRGWQQLVDALERLAVQVGVTIETGVEVDDVSTLETPGVVLAVPPAVAERIGDIGGLVDRAGPPVQAAVLDVVSRHVPARRLVLGLDEPTYASVHGPPAALGEGGAATACARYVRHDEEHDPKATRELLREQRRLLGIADSDVVEERYLHRLTVTMGQPLASLGGPAGRPPVEVPGRRGLFLAGDWVGGDGLLADAAFASGATAGRLAAAHAR